MILQQKNIVLIPCFFKDTCSKNLKKIPKIDLKDFTPTTFQYYSKNVGSFCLYAMHAIIMTHILKIIHAHADIRDLVFVICSPLIFLDDLIHVYKSLLLVSNYDNLSYEIS